MERAAHLARVEAGDKQTLAQKAFRQFLNDYFKQSESTPHHQISQGVIEDTYGHRSAPFDVVIVNEGSVICDRNRAYSIEDVKVVGEVVPNLSYRELDNALLNSKLFRRLEPSPKNKWYQDRKNSSASTTFVRTSSLRLTLR